MAKAKADGPRVLFLRTDPCTVEPRIQKESASLARCGYTVSAFGWDRRGTYPQQERIQDVLYRRTRIPAPYGSKLLAAVLPIFWVRAMWELLLRHPDVVHACDLDAFVPALLMRPLLRHRLVYDVFDDFAEKILGLPAGLRRILRRIDRSLMPRADAVIVTDEFRKERLRGLALRRLEVIMNVPPEVPTAPQPAPGGQFRLCYAGNIHRHRGLQVIAEALRGVDGIETVFAGWLTRREDEEYLQAQKHIRFLGKIPYAESLRLIASSDASFALYDPSLPINAMASSNKIFEAMAVGRPVFTNAETTMAPIVREEQCGCLVPFGDVEALRREVIRLRDHPEERGRLGSNGYAAFKKKYNWRLMEDRLAVLYRQVLGPS